MEFVVEKKIIKKQFKTISEKKTFKWRKLFVEYGFQKKKVQNTS